jgi:hypothetical protein
MPLVEPVISAVLPFNFVLSNIVFPRINFIKISACPYAEKGAG